MSPQKLKNRKNLENGCHLCLIWLCILNLKVWMTSKNNRATRSLVAALQAVGFRRVKCSVKTRHVNSCPSLSPFLHLCSLLSRTGSRRTATAYRSRRQPATSSALCPNATTAPSCWLWWRSKWRRWRRPFLMVSYKFVATRFLLFFLFYCWRTFFRTFQKFTNVLFCRRLDDKITGLHLVQR